METRRSTRLGTFLVVGLALLATGCPGLTVRSVALVPESVAPGRFTLAVAVEVVEEDPSINDNGELDGGRGILGVWLPPGWTVAAARIALPGTDEQVVLEAVTDADGHFAPSFPRVPGGWSGFVSPCQNLDAGSYLYDAELDLVGPATEPTLSLGLAAALFSDDGSNGPAPRQVDVDLAAGTATLLALPSPPAPTGLAACPGAPHDETMENACACTAPGVSNDQRHLLTRLLVALGRLRGE